MVLLAGGWRRRGENSAAQAAGNRWLCRWREEDTPRLVAVQIEQSLPESAPPRTPLPPLPMLLLLLILLPLLLLLLPLLLERLRRARECDLAAACLAAAGRRRWQPAFRSPLLPQQQVQPLQSDAAAISG